MEEEYQKVTWERLTKTLHKSIKHLLILDEFRKYEEHVALVPGNFEAFLAHVRERELIGRPFRYFRSRDISVQFLRDRISLVRLFYDFNYTEKRGIFRYCNLKIKINQFKKSRYCKVLFTILKHSRYRYGFLAKKVKLLPKIVNSTLL